jgi:hypothetical protein
MRTGVVERYRSTTWVHTWYRVTVIAQGYTCIVAVQKYSNTLITHWYNGYKISAMVQVNRSSTGVLQGYTDA